MVKLQFPTTNLSNYYINGLYIIGLFFIVYTGQEHDQKGNE